MAARKRLRLALKTRERIRTSMLINRLLNHVFGRCEMTPTQVKVALAVLRKTLPDLKPIKVVYEDAPRPPRGAKHQPVIVGASKTVETP